MFDKVFVPNERTIVAGDIEAYNGIMANRAGYTSLQATTRSTVKLRFLTGMALAIARANGRDKTPRYQAAIGELTALVTIAEGIRSGAMADILRRVEAFAQGPRTCVSGPPDTYAMPGIWPPKHPRRFTCDSQRVLRPVADAVESSPAAF